MNTVGKISISSISVFLLSGCSSKLNLPEITNKQKISTLSIEKISKEFHSTGGYYKYNRSNNDYYINRYLKNYCYLKNGIFQKTNYSYTNRFNNTDIKNGEFLKTDNSNTNIYNYTNSLRPVKEEIKYVCLINKKPHFFLFEQLRSFDNGVYNEYMNYKIDYSDYIKNNYFQYQKFKELRQSAFRKQIKLKKKQEVERKKRLKLQKISNAEKERKHIQLLQNRTGQYIMTFYDSWTYKGNEQQCSSKCIHQNMINTGFASLQVSLNYKWKFISKLSSTSKTLNNSCECKGTNILLQKKIK